MPKDITKDLCASMKICTAETQRCNDCMHFSDEKYPACMRELIKEGCAMIERLYKENAKLRAKIRRREKREQNDQV